MALRRPLCKLMATVAVAAAAAAWSGTAAAARATPAAAPTVSRWMITSRAIALIDGYLGTTTLTTNAFDVASTAEIGKPAAGWVSKRTAMYTFYGPVSKSSSFLYALKHD